MSINNDSVMRSVYYKYIHPKEVFIAEGTLVPDLIRKKVTSCTVFLFIHSADFLTHFFLSHPECGFFQWEQETCCKDRFGKIG